MPARFRVPAVPRAGGGLHPEQPDRWSKDLGIAMLRRNEGRLSVPSMLIAMRDPIHPGETLREDLDALGMSAAELARRIEVPVNRITEILNGRRAVTGDTALRLGRFFGTSGEFWLNLQKLHELRLAEQKSGAEIARLPSLGDGARLRASG